jgi:hypothetical protein
MKEQQAQIETLASRVRQQQVAIDTLRRTLCAENAAWISAKIAVNCRRKVRQTFGRRQVINEEFLMINVFVAVPSDNSQREEFEEIIAPYRRRV